VPHEAAGAACHGPGDTSDGADNGPGQGQGRASPRRSLSGALSGPSDMIADNLVNKHRCTDALSWRTVARGTHGLWRSD